MAPKNNGTKRPFWKKWWFWALIVVLVIGWVIEATESETEEDIAAVTETTESIATKELKTEKTEQTVETETSIEIEEPQTKIYRKHTRGDKRTSWRK